MKLPLPESLTGISKARYARLPAFGRTPLTGSK